MQQGSGLTYDQPRRPYRTERVLFLKTVVNILQHRVVRVWLQARAVELPLTQAGVVTSSVQAALRRMVRACTQRRPDA